MCNAKILEDAKKMIVDSYRDVYGNNLVAVYLYGSYARGDYDEYSDIDFAAIVDGERMMLQKQLKMVWEQTHEFGYEHDIIVSSTVIPYSEFIRYNNILPYYMNILKEGQRIG